MITDTITKEAFSMLSAILLAKITLIDGKIKLEELDAASMMLRASELPGKNKSDASKLFDYSVEGKEVHLYEQFLEKFIQDASLNQKCELIRDCWYIAHADYELHENEVQFIERLCQQLEVSELDSLLAKKSCGF